MPMRRGTINSFSNSVDAVKAAKQIQEEAKKELIVPLRIGIHLGDIVFDENEVYGDGVNLASRVESMGVPGCILVSDKLNFAVKNHSSISTKSLGHFEFKNIKDPVELFAVTNPDIKVPERSELKGKLKQNKKSIAVLPFVNMSSDPENEYFSDGITDDLITDLSKVSGLFVVARNSSFLYKEQPVKIKKVAEDRRKNRE